jgi:two-component system chemotaxis response regulator CheB
MKENKIQVLITEDSPVIALLLREILSSVEDIEVIACAKNGLEAVNLTKRLKPDLVTMDICMPIMDGFEATQEIMEQCPTPIIVITSHANNHELEVTFDAMQAGALLIIEKPDLNDNFSEIKKVLINSVRALSKVHVMKRRRKETLPIPISLIPINPLHAEILALGISTGGPSALKSILSGLPAQFPIPIVIVQHITKGFLQGLVSWLQKFSTLTLKIAENNQSLLPAHVYFAPDDMHLLIRKAKTPIAILDDRSVIGNFRPSVTALFYSLATSYPATAMGGLLTGMGTDGAAGLLKMREAGCLTFAQSKATSVVYGMPQAAIALNATKNSIDLDKIPEFLIHNI